MFDIRALWRSVQSITVPEEGHEQTDFMSMTAIIL